MSKQTQVTQRLRESGIRFKVISNGKQLIIEPEGRKVSFWPSSGKFYPRAKGNPAPTSHLNGVEDLIRYIKGA
jgi:hypothetical protein